MKRNSTIKRVFIQVSVLSTCILLTVNCSQLYAQFSFTKDFSYPVQLATAAAPNVWSPDRYAPNGFVNSTFLGRDVLKESISKANGAANRPANYQDVFRNTQGRSVSLPDGTTVLKVELYVPSEWKDANKRMAGLWGTAYDADNEASAYPIVEFASDTLAGGNISTPGFRGYNTEDGSWYDMGLPTGFAYDSWVTLEIDLNADGSFTYRAGDKTTTTPASTSVKLHNTILQGYNYDPGFAIDNTNPGVDYDIYWDNLATTATGNNVYNLAQGSVYTSIQDAIEDATANDQIVITGGTYNEQVLVNKGVSIKGGGATMPTIDFTGTPTGKPTLFDVSADKVTIDSLHFKVDLSKLGSAVIASSSAIDSISILNNIVDPYGTPAGAYGDRNAFSINYSGAVNYRVGGGVNSILFKNNTVNALSTTSAFRSGLSADEAAGVFTGNKISSINQDLLIRFLPAGSVTVDGNEFDGGGVEINSTNNGSGEIVVENNTFDGTLGNSYTSSLRLKDNYKSKPTVVRNNIFKNHTWGISLESFDADTIDHNEFTPLSSATHYRHITFNTKDISSTSGYDTPKVGGIFTNNTFNASADASAGIAIAFYNHDNDSPVFEPIILGEEGMANSFDPGIAQYIYLDNSNETSTDAMTAAYPEYGGNIKPTITGYWTANIDGSNNMFDAGSGLMEANSMNYYQINAVAQKIIDKTTDANIGQVILKLPVINVTKEAASTSGEKFRYQTIQDAIDAASESDSLYASAWVYNEDVNVNKAGLKLNGDLHYGTDTSIIVGQLNSNPSLNANANNVTISNLMITRAGNNIDDFVTNPKVTGVNIGQLKQGITLRNLLVTGNRNGIYLNNVKGTTIEQCDVIFNRTGIQLVNNCDNTSIIDNNILNNWTLGVVCYNASAGPTNTVDVKYNKISGNWYSNVENRTVGTVLNFAGNNWGVDSVYSITDPAGELGYEDVFPVEYGGSATPATGNGYLISGATDRVDYTAWLPAVTPNAIDNDVRPGYIPQDTSIVYVDEASPTAPGMTKLERAANIVAAGGRIVMTTDTIHSTIVPGKSINLEGQGSNVVIDGIDFSGIPAGATPDTLILNQSVTITQTLDLSGGGVIKMGEGDSLIVDASTATITNGDSGYVDGIMAVKNLDPTTGGDFVFPVGDSANGAQYIALLGLNGTTPSSFAISYADSAYTDNTLASDDDGLPLTSVSTSQYWILKRTDGDAGGKVTLYDFSKTIPATTVIAHFGSDGKWHNLGGTYTSTENWAAITAEIASDDFSPFTFGSTDISLPLKATGFNARLDGNIVSLSWMTNTENNNKGFAIERSKDGKNWIQIAFVNSLATNGNSSKTLNYAASDNAPYQGINYYRLKQVAVDGKYEYSGTRSVTFGITGSVSVYPNPATTQVTVTNMQGRIYVFDVSGKLIFSQTATMPDTTLDISKLTPGIYFIKDENGNTIKFIKN